MHCTMYICVKKTVHTDIIKKHNNISVSLRRLEIEQGSERKGLIIHQGEGRGGAQGVRTRNEGPLTAPPAHTMLR